MNPGYSVIAADEFLRRRLNQAPQLIEFTSSLVAGVRKNRREIDALLAERAENWTLSRMAVTDRNVLRLGVYEILHTETPDRVAINEAIELARRFGSEHSAKFVNGVLDRVFHERDGSNQLAEPETSRPPDGPADNPQT